MSLCVLLQFVGLILAGVGLGLVILFRGYDFYLFVTIVLILVVVWFWDGLILGVCVLLNLGGLVLLRFILG